MVTSATEGTKEAYTFISSFLLVPSHKQKAYDTQESKAGRVSRRGYIGMS
jgi:hypothetical protein